MRIYTQRISASIVGLILVASVALFAVMQVKAQDTSGSGLSVSPTRTELKIERGKTDIVEINIRNVTQGQIIAKPLVSDFESDDATGEPRLYFDAAKRNSASISKFVNGLTDVTLEPGEDKNLTYTINIPQDAVAGGYYGAIAFRAVPANQVGPESGQVALTANVASLVLIEIPGDITEQIQLKGIKVLKGNKEASFFTGVPSKIAIGVQNNGNSFSKPFGTVSITDMSGKRVHSYELNNSTPRNNILPKTSRTFTDDIKGVKKPGRYTVTADISHGSGGEVITQKVSFWYMPVWLIITLLVLLGAVIGGAYYLYRKQFGKKSK